MRRPILIDTNLLVDAVDPREEARARVASLVVDYVAHAGIVVLSTQIVAEYFDVTTRRKAGHPPIFTRAQAALSIARILDAARCVDITTAIVRVAIRVARVNKVRIYDAQLTATANAYDIATIVTADLPGGRTEMEGIRYVDPFARSFQLADIGL